MTNPNCALRAYAYKRGSKAMLINYLEGHPNLELVGEKKVSKEANGYWWPVGTKYTDWGIFDKETGDRVLWIGINAGKQYSDFSWHDSFLIAANHFGWNHNVGDQV